MLLLHVDYHLFMLFFFCLDEFFIGLFSFSFSKLFHFGKFHISFSLSCNIGIQFMNNLSLFINDLMGVLKHTLKLFVSFLKIILELILKVLGLNLLIFFQSVYFSHISNGCMRLLFSYFSIFNIKIITILFELCNFLFQSLNLFLQICRFFLRLFDLFTIFYNFRVLICV